MEKYGNGEVDKVSSETLVMGNTINRYYNHLNENFC